MTQNFTLLFLFFFALTLGIRLWLKLRHIRFVAAHRTAVPPEFAERVTLETHQKAADYQEMSALQALGTQTAPRLVP